MKMKSIILTVVVAICMYGFAANAQRPHGAGKKEVTKEYKLPAPKTDGAMSVEKALSERRSRRNFSDAEISFGELSQLLWAAYGVTLPAPGRPALKGGFRTAPSAGALYPFEIYVVAGKVNGVEPGVYRYIPAEHKIVRVVNGDKRKELSKAAYNQTMIEKAPAAIVYTAVFSRMTGKYGNRGRERYVCMDLGHSAQNIYLQAEALGMGTCAVGAFDDEKIAGLLGLPLMSEEEPLYIMPVGYCK